jgi:DsbC/DsbD-like thiol-disulfide interchange protein
VTHTGQPHSGNIGAGRIRTAAVVLAIAAVSGLTYVPARAEAPPVSRAELVSGTEAVRPGQPFWLAIHIQLDEGWHTYWRNPGDAGARPQVSWHLPSGMEAEPLLWPYPSVFREGRLVTYGYSGSAWLFTRMTLPVESDSGEAVPIGADVEWLVCRDICIPQYAELMLSVPIVTDDENGPLPSGFAEALATVPQTSPWPAFYTMDSEHVVLTIRAPAGVSSLDAADAWFFPYEYGIIEHAADQQVSSDDRGLLVRTRRDASNEDLSENIAGVLVVRGEAGHDAYEITAVPASTEETNQ